MQQPADQDFEEVMRDHISNFVGLDYAPPSSGNKMGKFGTLQDIVCNFLFNDQNTSLVDNMALNLHLNQALSQDNFDFIKEEP